MSRALSEKQALVPAALSLSGEMADQSSISLSHLAHTVPPKILSWYMTNEERNDGNGVCRCCWNKSRVSLGTIFQQKQEDIILTSSSRRSVSRLWFLFIIYSPSAHFKGTECLFLLTFGTVEAEERIPRQGICPHFCALLYKPRPLAYKLCPNWASVSWGVESVLESIQ